MTPDEGLEQLAHALFDAFDQGIAGGPWFAVGWDSVTPALRKGWLQVAQTASDGASIAAMAATEALAAELAKATAELQGVHGELRAAGIEGDPASHWAPLLVSMLARQRDEARDQLAIQHEAMTQLRAGHAEALAGADSQVSAALKTVSRWQGENERLTAELATCRERNAAIAAQSDRYRDERDEALAGFIDTADRDEYQLVITEMIAHWERIGTSREEDRLIDGDGEAPGWRKRGGLEAS